MRILAFLIAVLLTACGGDSSDDFPSGDNLPSDNSPGGQVDTGDSESITGVWDKGCHQNTELGAQAQLRVTFTNDGNAVLRYQNYTDTGCVEAGYLLEVEANYTVAGEVVLSSGQTVQRIVFSNHSVFMTLPDQGYAASYNQNSFCGITTWQAGNRTDIGTCAPSAAVVFARNIYLADGSRLYEGTPGSAFSAELRSGYFSKSSN